MRYYYAELSAFGYRLNDMQKKSIAWLLSELNECVVSQLRTYWYGLLMNYRFAVKDYIHAGLSDNVRMAIIRRSRSKLRKF